jgi:glyceraldehyde-3-phosphate dehydrogenase/erythrose-4-phosphate dehydrogenase
VKRPESAILDAEFAEKSGTLYRFPLWYGNEWGYVRRLCEALHEQAS